MKTEVVDLQQEQCSSKYGVCYASGGTFKPTARGASTFVVEIGKRRLVSRALCVLRYYKSRCEVCPFSGGGVVITPRGGDG